MLIKCPECGKEISDKAPQCIHCGFPLSNTINLNSDATNKIYRIVLFGGEPTNRIQLYRYIMDITNKPLTVIDQAVKSCSSDLFRALSSEQAREVQSNLTSFGLKCEIQEDSAEYFNALKCPRCGSTAVSVGNRGVTLTSGFFGASKTMNRCGNCGHKWKPR